MGIERIENFTHSFKMHSSMCLELKKLVDRIMRILPAIEEARPGSSSGIHILCVLNKALEKAKLLLQYCSESSKLYMAVTGDAILQRGRRAKNSLEQSLTDIRSMVPTVLASKISQIVQDLRSTRLTLESFEEEAGKTIRELMRRSTSSSVSSDEVKEFYFAALKLQLSTPEATMIERRSLKLLLAKLGECDGNKRQILRYLICLLKKHERIICRDHRENSFPMRQSINDSVSAGVAEAGCSEERNVTLPEQFKCPLSLTVMYDPVIISSGHTFERMWIQKWFDEGNDSCPTSKMRLDDFTLEPNMAIKNQISKWCSKHGLDVQDPATKYTNTKAFQNIDFSISSVASFGSSLYNIPDLSCMSITDLNSSYSLDSPSYSKISRGSYFARLLTIDSESGTGTADSTVSEMEIEPLCGLTSLPWDAQSKLIEDVRSHFERNTQAFRSMSPSRFLEPLITYLKNAHERNGAVGEIIKIGLDLLSTFLSVNRRAIEVLEEDVFKMFSVFLESEVVIAEEALNILEVISNHPNGLSKLTSSGSLSSLLKIVESQTEHLQEQAMITLKNLSTSNEICLEMIFLDFVQKLTYFLQQNFFSKHSIVILRNLCNTEKGRVCITETPGCLAYIAELLDSNVHEEQENAISILLQLCVQKMEYCDLVVREGADIYSSLLLISNNGTEEAKIGASEMLRALEEVYLDREEEQQQTEEEESSLRPEEEESSLRPEEEANASTTSQVVVTHEEPITATTPSPKKSHKQIDSSVCLELKNLVNRIMRIHHNLEDAVSEKITTQEVDESMIWDLGSDEGNEYLGAVNELRVLIDRLDGSSGLVGKTGTEELLSLRKAHDVLNMAMARLRDEFKHMLVKNRLPSELERVSFWSSEADSGVEDGSMASFSVASTEDLILGSNRIRRNSGELMVDLINPDVISDLRNIANTMIALGYDRECIQAYTVKPL